MFGLVECVILNPCSFVSRCCWCHVFTKYRNSSLESLTFGATSLLIFPTNQESRNEGAPGCLRGCHNWSKGYPPPRGSENQVGKKTHHSLKGSRNWDQHGSQHLKVCRILGDFVDYLFASSFGALLIDFQMVL